MNRTFHWVVIAIGGVALAAAVDAKPSRGNSSSNQSSSAPAPRAYSGASGGGYRNMAPSGGYRPSSVPNYSGPRTYSSGQRFSPMAPRTSGSSTGYRRSGPVQNFGGTSRTYSGGQRFSSMPTRDTSWRQTFPRSDSRTRSTSDVQSSTVRQPRFDTAASQRRTNSGSTTTRDRFDRTRTSTRSGDLATRSGDRSGRLGNVNRSSTTTQKAVFDRRSANWQPNWNRNRDHSWNGHRCRFINGSWVIFNIGFYPWWPIGYPYDYYYGYGYYPYGYGYDPYAYGYGYGYDPGYSGYGYDDGSYYGGGAYSGGAYGDQSGDSSVAAAQERLAQMGYYHGQIDGVFGPETQRALLAFQRDRGLDASGYLTQETRQALGLRG